MLSEGSQLRSVCTDKNHEKQISDKIKKKQDFSYGDFPEYYHKIPEKEFAMLQPPEEL